MHLHHTPHPLPDRRGARRAARATAHVATFLVVLTLVACGRSDASTLEHTPRAIPVEVTPVIEESLAAPVTATGTLGGKEEVALSFTIGGVIARVLVDEGGIVRQGQLLAELVPVEAAAQVTKAEEGRDKTVRDLARVRTLHADSIAATEQLQDATTALAIAEQDVNRARFTLDHAAVYAPTSGVVLRRLAEPSQVVGAAVPVLNMRTKGNGVVLRVALSDRDALRERAGDPATVRFDALPGERFTARITLVAALAASTTGTLDVELTLERRAESLASGLIGRAVIVVRDEGRVTVVPLAHGNIFLRLLDRTIDATYARLLHRPLARPRISLLVDALLFVASLALIPAVAFSLFPKAGTPQFMISVETRDEWSMDETDRVVREVERTLLARRDVRSVFSNIGKGNPQVCFNVTPGSERNNVAELFVLLDVYDGRRTPVMLDSLRRRFDAITNARIVVRECENGLPLEAQIALRLTGDNLDTLRAVSGRVESLVATTAGTRDVVNPLRVNRTDLKFDIDRAKAGLPGVPTIAVDRTERLGIAGLRAGSFRDRDGEEYDVTVRLARGERQTLDALDRILVGSVRGTLVPLSQVATMRFESSPPLIQHVDAARAVTVTAYVCTGFNTDRVTKGVLASVGDVQLPAGYRIIPAGEIESRQESFGGLGTAILLATIGILAVLILEFRTFKEMLIVASVIPLGIVGGIAALLVSGYTLSFTAIIGFVALIGIEIKNSILRVDFTNQLREKGMELHATIEAAGKIRFVPIVLTTLTAIGGLLPLALQGSSLYSPLALVIIGGLVSSTIQSRLVTPVMYMLLPPWLGGAEHAEADVQVARVVGMAPADGRG